MPGFWQPLAALGESTAQRSLQPALKAAACAYLSRQGPLPPRLQACQRMMEKLVAENDALTDHLNRQALELSGLRSAMAAAAQFAQAADADAAAAEAAAAAAAGYMPPASPMRQLSGGLGGLQRALSDASATVAAAAGLPSPGRPSSAASPRPVPPSPGPAAPPAPLASPGGSGTLPAAGPPGGAGAAAAWELPGGVVLSEQQLQLLALAEEVRRLGADSQQAAQGSMVHARLF